MSKTESTSPFGESHLRAGGAFLPLRVARESRLKPHDFAVFGKGRRIKCVFVPYLAFPRAPRRLLETKLSLAAYRVHRSTVPSSGIQQSYRGFSVTQPPPKLCEQSRHDVAERLIGGSFPRGAPQPPPFASVAPLEAVRARMAQFLRRKFADLAIKIWEPKMAPIAASNISRPSRRRQHHLRAHVTLGLGLRSPGGNGIRGRAHSLGSRITR